MTEEILELQEPRGVAYSYVRFSTVKQELGDSLRRQVESCEKYCKEHNLELHPVSYRDLGVSAFKRRNIEKGALSSFIEAVKTGKVAKGSYLIIEQFDRMSRAQTSIALTLLLDLLNAGIKVVTLEDKRVWDSSSINSLDNLMLAIVYMSRANNESQAKADRLTAVWKKKKEAAAEGTAKRIVTSECPRWLRPNEDKTGFEPLPERVESIKKVFDMRIKGFGISSIVTRANAESWPCPGKPPVRKAGESVEDFALRAAAPANWHTSTVGRLLQNRALLGEYLPFMTDPEDYDKRIPAGDPIPGYYPAVLDETTFLRAQAKAERSGRFPGRRDASLKNWLQGILKCNCGHSFVRKNKDSKAQPGYSRYYCTARNRGVSKCPGANAGQLEEAVLYVVSNVAPAIFSGSSRAEELKANAEVLEVEVSARRTVRDRFVEAIGSSGAPIPALVKKLNEAEMALQGAEKALSTIRAEIADIRDDPDEVFNIIAKQVREVDSIDARAELRENLSRIIEKVVVHQADGYIQVFLRGSEVPVVHPIRFDNLSIPGLTITPSEFPPERFGDDEA